ncbi:hypothetical protein PQE75_gp150 [Bacillus phage vB_BcoS-136]|uniref:Uncharacterized protein n=1 Tax=Bacillus phage vB_BcoS-136 TaxID=2419619 RepID=A0A3G3BVN2_9CAUD|nr:hypothetical protein PQE75_gp150 [Bacillus phage vB_BcoS-136]AYP68329.1 hypothetical protein vBBcoS136_00215 [Bacillus phage vB_BcoS-136]
MNKVDITLNKDDIEYAILLYLSKKYPNLQPESMRIEYNRGRQVGSITGYLK